MGLRGAQRGDGVDLACRALRGLSLGLKEGLHKLAFGASDAPWLPVGKILAASRIERSLHFYVAGLTCFLRTRLHGPVSVWLLVSGRVSAARARWLFSAHLLVLLA